MSCNPPPYRKARSEHSVTVELQLHELPPPPNPTEKFVDALRRAIVWAPDCGEDLLDAVQELIKSATKRAAQAATKEAA